jgi:hypothetical protein
LPECSGRIDSAVKIVLAGDVELLPDGTAKVASQSNGTIAYHVVNGHCNCRDFSSSNFGDQPVSHWDSSSRPRIMNSIK